MVIPALYKDAYGPSSDSPITSLEDLPPDTMGLGNHIQISNVYTLSPTFGTDEAGNNRLQRPTWIFFQGQDYVPVCPSGRLDPIKS